MDTFSLKNILINLYPKHRSEIFKRSIWNASYSTIEYIATPLLYLFSTPFLVHQLGINHYGIWMLANSVAGVIGVMNFGLSEATVKYVSMYRGRGDQDGVVRCILSTFTLYFFLAILMIIVCWILAPFLVKRIFKISEEDFTVAIWAMKFAGIVLGLRTVGSVFLSALRGYERYDLTSKINIVTLSLMTLSSVILVYIGYGIEIVLFGIIIVSCLSLLGSIIVVKKHVPRLNIRLTFDISSTKEIFSFGLFSWVQGIAATIFAQADRLLIGSLLGTSAIAYYSVSINVAQQVHAAVGASMGFIFPLVSSEREKENGINLKRLFNRTFLFGLFISLSIMLPLLICGKFFLTIWMGADFAANSYILMSILLCAFFLLALNVIPHYFLLGFGEIRFVSLTNIAGGILSLIGMVFFIPLLGMNGAAISRLLYAPMVSINFMRLKKLL